MQTDNTNSLAYAMTYLVQVFELSYTLDCSRRVAEPFEYSKYNFQLQDDFFAEKQMLGQTDISTIISTLQDLLGELDYVMALVYALLDSQQVYTNWQSGNYFLSGLYTGQGAVSIYYSVYTIITKYFA